MPDRPLSALKETIGESRTTVVDLTVEAGKVEEFARAIHDDNPVHRDVNAAREQGFDSIPAPLTFTRTSFFERYRPESVDENLGFDLGLRSEHLVHGEQGYEYERPVMVGDTLSGETILEDVYQREGRRGGTLTFVVFRTEFRNEDGQLVLTESNTRIETEGAIDGDGNGVGRAESGGAVDIGGGDGDLWTGRRPNIEDVSIGDEGPTVVESVSREDFVRYAGASGDFHRVHYDEQYATEAGNPTVFGQGMFTAGIAAHMVADWLGLANVTRFRTRFDARLWPGETITARGEVAEKTVDSSQAEVTVEFGVTNSAGASLVTGSAAAVYALDDV